MIARPRRPAITVAVPLKLVSVTRDIDALVDRFTVSALRFLQAAGADPRVLDLSGPSRANPNSALDNADGLVLLGGGDLDPDLYDHKGPVPNGYGVDRWTDDYTLSLILAARQRLLPTLGICRGSQLLNYAFGGTLIPDIADFKRHRGAPPGPVFLDETVELDPGCWLYDLYKGTSLKVRSGHHQAVGEVAPGFRAAAVAADGIVEAIESVTQWSCRGVQWHPEDRDGDVDAAQRLFDDFAARCAAPHRSTSGLGAIDDPGPASDVDPRHV